MKFAYKPFGLLISVLGGLLAAQVFARVWKLLPTKGDKAPKATDAASTWQEVAVGAAVQGLVFGVVKALTNRAGAKGFEKATGIWPGDTSPA